MDNISALSYFVETILFKFIISQIIIYAGNSWKLSLLSFTKSVCQQWQTKIIVERKMKEKEINFAV